MYTYKKLFAFGVLLFFAPSLFLTSFASDSNPFDIFNNSYESSQDSSIQSEDASVVAPTPTKTGSTTTTIKIPAKVKLVANPFELLPLYEGQTKKNARRINLIFVWYKYAGVKKFLAATKKIVGYDTAATGALNECIGECQLRNGNMKFLSHDLFAIEPFKSKKDSFNLWYYPSVLLAKNDAGVIAAAAGLQNTYIIRMYDHDMPENATTLPATGLPESFSGTVDASQILFDATNVLMPGFDASEDERLYNSKNRTHEKGALLAATLAKDLFGLESEQEGTGKARYSYPNCTDALNHTEVLNSFSGQLDKAYTQWQKDFFATYGVELPISQTGMTVASFSGACGTASGSESVFRTTQVSLLSGPQTYSGATNGLKFDYLVPVFGSVNRAWIEKILQAFDSSEVKTVVGSGIPMLTLRNLSVFDKEAMAKILASLPATKRRPYAEGTLTTINQILKIEGVTKKQKVSLARLRLFIKNYLKGYK